MPPPPNSCLGRSRLPSFTLCTCTFYFSCIEVDLAAFTAQIRTKKIESQQKETKCTCMCTCTGNALMNTTSSNQVCLKERRDILVSEF